MTILFKKDGDFFSFERMIKSNEFESLKKETEPENKYVFLYKKAKGVPCIEKLTDIFDFKN